MTRTIPQLIRMLLLAFVHNSHIAGLPSDDRRMFNMGLFAISNPKAELHPDEKKAAIKVYQTQMSEIDRLQKLEVGKIGKSMMLDFFKVLELSGFPVQFCNPDQLIGSIVGNLLHLEQCSNKLRSLKQNSEISFQILHDYENLVQAFNLDFINQLFSPEVQQQILRSLNAQSSVSDLGDLGDFFSRLLSTTQFSAEFLHLNVRAIAQAIVIETNTNKLKFLIQKLCICLCEIKYGISEDLRYPMSTLSLMLLICECFPKINIFLKETMNSETILKELWSPLILGHFRSIQENLRFLTTKLSTELSEDDYTVAQTIFDLSHFPALLHFPDLCSDLDVFYSRLDRHDF